MQLNPNSHFGRNDLFRLDFFVRLLMVGKATYRQLWTTGVNEPLAEVFFMNAWLCSDSEKRITQYELQLLTCTALPK